MSNKENYERIQKMILDGEDVGKINAEFDAARTAIDSIDVKISQTRLIPDPFRTAWCEAYEKLNTICASPKSQLVGLRWCIDIIDCLEWKHYI